MARLRVPIAGLMAAVVIVALDAAMIRSLLSSNFNIPTSATTSLDIVVFAFGVLPMASLLIFLALVRLPKLLRRGGSASFFFGFEVFGWAAVFLFILGSALSPSAVAGYANSIASLFAPALKPHVEHAPDWFLAILEFGLCGLIFGLPQLGIALLGGWLTRRAGISVSIERRQTSGIRPNSEQRDERFESNLELERTPAAAARSPSTQPLFGGAVR
jgi:hypothetical protein